MIEGEEVSHTEPVAAPSWLCCAPDPPCAIPSHAEASTAIPGAQGVWSMLYSTLPALTERVKAPLPDPLLLCLHRTPSAVRSPLDIGGSQSGPYPSLSSGSSGCFPPGCPRCLPADLLRRSGATGGLGWEARLSTNRSE